VGCSSCEAYLDRYVDGDLEPRRAAWVAQHLQQCAECERLHRRLRIVDALLETVRPFELDDDFTPSVMTTVFSLPLPAAARRPWPILIAAYLFAGWIVLAGAFFELRAHAAVGTGIAHAVTKFFGALGPIAHSLSPVTPYAVSAVVLVLTIDVLLFALVALYYRRLAPHLALRLAGVETR
jgi:anti-sigma factor RsiW